MANFGMVLDPVISRTSKPTPLEPSSIRNVRHPAEERLDQGRLLAQEQPDTARLRHQVARLCEGVQRKFRRHKINRCAWVKPVTKLVNHTFVAAIP